MAEPRSIALGHTSWAFAAPGIPVSGHGPEPCFTSRDTLSLLNTGDVIANVRLHVHYTWEGGAGPFRLTVAPRRLRRIRINDLIFPEAVRLGVPYGLRVASDRPVLAQLTAQYTDSARRAGFWMLAFADRGPGKRGT